MELQIEAGRQVGTATNSTASFAGYLDGEMDSKGMCSSPLEGTKCQGISGLVLVALCGAPSRLPLPPVLPSWSPLHRSHDRSFSFKSLLLRRTCWMTSIC